MLTSRLMSRGRTTVPHEVREALGLVTGDTLVFELKVDGVLLRSASLPFDDPFATFDTWAGDEDVRAYANL